MCFFGFNSKGLLVAYEIQTLGDTIFRFVTCKAVYEQLMKASALLKVIPFSFVVSQSELFFRNFGGMISALLNEGKRK